jgi:hypothetical protein
MRTQAGHLVDARIISDHQAQPAGQRLLAAGRHAALREAFCPPSSMLPAADHVLIQDRPLPYAMIGWL